MSQVSTIGLDIAKHVFHVHGADERGLSLFSRRLSRSKVLEFFAGQPRCVVALEACGGAHHWARKLTALGHEVRLIAPAYVKPFVKRNKNDALDAEAICEAAQRPNMRFVAVKSEEQQAAALVFRTRDLLVRQRTQTINAIRSHMAEYGWVAPKGPSHIAALAGLLEELPEAARAMIRVMLDALDQLDRQVAGLDREIARRAREDEVSRRLMTIPGIGPLTATALAALAPPPEEFTRGRDFAAWLGLVPLQHSTGGKQRLGSISKAGERTLRRVADPRQQRGRASCQPPRSTARIVARRHAGEKAAHAGGRGAGQQDGADRLGRADEAGGLQGSGRGRGVSRSGPEVAGRREEGKGGYGATVGETGPEEPGLSNVPPKHA